MAYSFDELDTKQVVAKPLRRANIAAAICIAFAGCGASRAQLNRPIATGASAASSATQQTTTSATGPTALGATLEAWEAHHPDNQFEHTGNNATDYQGHAGPFVTGANAKWQFIAVRGGHVVSFGLSLPLHTTVDTALTEAMAQLPGDAHLMSRLKLSPGGSGSNECEWVLARSATLAQVLATTTPSDPTGEVTMMFNSPNESSGSSFDQGEVDQALIAASPPLTEEPCNTQEP